LKARALLSLADIIASACPRKTNCFSPHAIEARNPKACRYGPRWR
jgi:hypothetical protein